MFEKIQALKSHFNTGKTRSPHYRQAALKALQRTLIVQEKSLLAGLAKDLGKSEHEAILSELGMCHSELKQALKNIERWSRPQRVATPLSLWPAQSWIYPEPKGVCLLIAPWNYPIQLALVPLIAALAAGNCVVLKPSELAPACSQALAALIREAFLDFPGLVSVIEGGIQETTELLRFKFDHIFFTGSTAVGRIVSRAAAEHLTPVTLELGGKCPCIVDSSANLDMAARRIVWGKFMNAGQTCIAPDYVFVHKSVKDPLLEKIKSELIRQFGDEPRGSGNYSRIINLKNFSRLKQLIATSTVAVGGDAEETELYISPTILTPVEWESPVMESEIFGPILPLLEYSELAQVISLIKSKPKPLAAYLFSDDTLTVNQFLEETQFGGGCINDTVLHIGNSNLPFGGVGESGSGSYHGHFGFSTFTHYKSVLKSSLRLDIPLRYAPSSPTKLRWIRRFLGVP